MLEETEGNPFFMTEVVGWLRSEGRLIERSSSDGAWTIRIPESVREAIGNRLDRLSQETNETLTIASPSWAASFICTCWPGQPRSRR